VVRAASLEGYQKSIPRLKRIAQGKVPAATVADTIRAAEVLARHGMAEPAGMPVADVRDKVARTLDVMRRILPPDLAQAVVAELPGIWRTTS
jgi:hypothetical protein